MTLEVLLQVTVLTTKSNPSLHQKVEKTHWVAQWCVLQSLSAQTNTQSLSYKTYPHTCSRILISGNHRNLYPHSSKVPGRTLAACCWPINNQANKTPVLCSTKCSMEYAKQVNYGRWQVIPSLFLFIDSHCKAPGNKVRHNSSLMPAHFFFPTEKSRQRK